jgi:hypothetical protein
MNSKAKESTEKAPKKTIDLRSVFKSEKSLKTIVIGGIVLVFLLFLSSAFADIVPSQSHNADNRNANAVAECEETRLEQKLKRAISAIDGVGELTVVITLDSLSETIYAERGSSVRTVITPRVRGVAIIADGADSPVVQQRIIEVTSRLLGVNTTRISVTH